MDESRTNVAVVILTFNEELNIAQALESVCGWAREVFVLDSFSADRTLEIARGHGASGRRESRAGYRRGAFLPRRKRACLSRGGEVTERTDCYG